MTTETASASPDNKYHHGNLRLALLDAAIAQIKDVGVDKLSLRGIARTVGVSQTAPYRHFKDKNQLLADVAAQAFIELYERSYSLIDPNASALENIQATGMAYLQYAIENPEKYRLLFGSSIKNRRSYSAMVEAGEQSFRILIDQVERGIKAGDFIPGCPLLLANTLWTQVHGSASLILDGFYQDRELPMPFDDFLKAQIMIASRALLLNPMPISLDKNRI
ncbi:MAG: TetR/AcrR family transcriptional regulator [Oleispira sp.]|nr:TetR/AcrR family transcriptional regulator [Oleispira sp.]MBL4881826.1 TetR/AcrR family transcriptional regulator [Oleispira sp.]